MDKRWLALLAPWGKGLEAGLVCVPGVTAEWPPKVMVVYPKHPGGMEQVPMRSGESLEVQLQLPRYQAFLLTGMSLASALPWDSITSTCSDCCIRGENAGGLSWTVKCVRSQSTSLHQNVAQALPNCKEGELYIMRKLRLRGVEDSRSPRSDRLCSLHLCRSIVLFCSLPGLSSEAQNKHAYPLLDPSFS
ncbi:uncharacterized protein LOC118919346 isoform X2 [Manis pentadactyla]|uniref:uncharacterized protein LOC118919346 isoform X2 n=1 Tax=Manis pentadactyla TaxID=143292 RepID=UPI00255CB674|nr:uncharacterized protein LOC118919346 isoform X2 [Manis pentadactyla]